MGKIVKGAFGFSIALAVLLVAYRAWRVSLYADLPVAKIADIETGELFFMLFGIGLVLFVVLIIWAIKQARHEDYYAPRNDVIQAGYTELPNYHAPVAQLPGPRRVVAPVYNTMGAPQPLGATRTQASQVPETVVTTVAQDDAGNPSDLEIPLKYLYRFASLPTPAREGEWVGKTTTYTLCRKFFATHGFLDDAGKWKSEYPMASRREWLEQFEPTADELLNTRTRAREE